MIKREVRILKVLCGEKTYTRHQSDVFSHVQTVGHFMAEQETGTALSRIAPRDVCFAFSMFFGYYQVA